MAKPDLNDGYLRVAHELDAALACAGFGRDQRIILHEVFAMIFGPAKLKTVDLSPSAIGTRYGLPKQSIGRALTSLLESGVLIRDGFGFRFIKDYERWTWKGEPMLTPPMIAECRKAPKAAMSHVNKNVDSSTTTASSNSLTDTRKTSSDLLTNQDIQVDRVNKFDDAASTNALTDVNKFDDATHYLERAGLRIENLEKKRESAPSSSIESPSVPPIGKTLSPEAEAIIALAERRWNELLEPGTFARDLCYDYDVSWVRRALDETYDKYGRDELPRPWVRGKLQAWFKAGGPPESKFVGTSNGKPRSGEAAYKPSPTPGYLPPQPRQAGPKIPAAEALKILKGESA